jgi:hypothetical protein
MNIKPSKLINSYGLLIGTGFLFLFIIACNSGDKPGKAGKDKMTIQKKFNESGVLIAEVSLKNGVRNGPTTNYYENGKVHSVVNYVEGRQEGETIWYYENGKPYQVTPFINGEEQGIQKKYYESGRLLAEVPYIRGHQQPGMKEYTETGELITDYPEIVFEKPVKSDVPGRFMLKMHMSDNTKEVVFEQKIISSIGDTTMNKIPTTDGIGEIPFFVDKGKTVTAQIHIRAKVRTRLKNIYLTEYQYFAKITNK